jgi:acetyl-CoA carboxylase carboxyl transferase subunit alpha
MTILDFEQPIAELEEKIRALQGQGEPLAAEQQAEVSRLESECEAKKKEIYSQLTPWQTVQVARHPERPLMRDFIAGLFTDFIELHGDRCYGDDTGIIGGLATMDNYRVMLVGHQKARTVEDNIKCNFGMGHPEGYRKALRLMRLAEKYRLPVICFIDTPGAYPGAGAEERGQAEAIARNLTEMSVLKTPIIALVTGEGGSGGALGIGVGDVILMLANAVYSVISPEGCASILWRDGSKASEAATALKITAPELEKLGVVDGIVPEPYGGAQRNYPATMEAVKKTLLKHLKQLQHTKIRKLLARRFDKYARIGRSK